MTMFKLSHGIAKIKDDAVGVMGTVETYDRLSGRIDFAGDWSGYLLGRNQAKDCFS